MIFGLCERKVYKGFKSKITKERNSQVSEGNEEWRYVVCEIIINPKMDGEVEIGITL